jgi:hypothetical protein
MERTREKPMSKGVLLYAFNTENVDYYKMAIATAKRANHFLNLPVSVITDESTILENYDYKFDNVFIQDADKSNRKGRKVWINKGRYSAYEFSPYDETILLDTDYLINSDKLLQLFQIYEDFMCCNRTSFLMAPHDEQEIISLHSFTTLWATLIVFRKSDKAKQIFDCLEMVQKNYSHYATLYGFLDGMYRNDYALTFALRIVNGNTINNKDYIPWNLVHLGKEAKAHRINDSDFNTEYLLIAEADNNKKHYIKIKDTDFHLLDKSNFMELVDG